jgi:hypothetical protein
MAAACSFDTIPLRFGQDNQDENDEGSTLKLQIRMEQTADDQCNGRHADWRWPLKRVSKLSGPGEISIPMRYGKSTGASELGACEVDCILVASGFDLSHDLCIRLRLRDLRPRWSATIGLLCERPSNSARPFELRLSQLVYLGVGQKGRVCKRDSDVRRSGQTRCVHHQGSAKRGATVVEPPKEAEQAWVDTIRGLASTNYRFPEIMHPWLL